MNPIITFLRRVINHKFVMMNIVVVMETTTTGPVTGSLLLRFMFNKIHQWSPTFGQKRTSVDLVKDLQVRVSVKRKMEPLCRGQSRTSFERN